MIGPTPLPNTSITNQFVSPCFIPTGMSTEPINFPNLVTGFDRNPQHAARAALYTRYTSGEWLNYTKGSYSEAENGRKFSESMRADAVHLLRKTDEKTSEGKFVV